MILMCALVLLVLILCVGCNNQQNINNNLCGDGSYENKAIENKYFVYPEYVFYFDYLSLSYQKIHINESYLLPSGLEQVVSVVLLGIENNTAHFSLNYNAGPPACDKLECDSFCDFYVTDKSDLNWKMCDVDSECIPTSCNSDCNNNELFSEFFIYDDVINIKYRTYYYDKNCDYDKNYENCFDNGNALKCDEGYCVITNEFKDSAKLQIKSLDRNNSLYKYDLEFYTIVNRYNISLNVTVKYICNDSGFPNSTINNKFYIIKPGYNKIEEEIRSDGSIQKEYDCILSFNFSNGVEKNLGHDIFLYKHK